MRRPLRRGDEAARRWLKEAALPLEEAFATSSPMDELFTGEWQNLLPGQAGRLARV